jgi:hypothetical protein
MLIDRKEKAMHRFRIRALTRALTAVGSAAVAVVALALPAQAHEAVLLDSSDVLPWKAPLIVDGTDAAALYGTLSRAGDVRSAQLRLTAGQPLIVGYAIPALAPENALPTAKLPRVAVIGPDGSVHVVSPTSRIPLHNPELNQDYLLLGQYSATAVTGTYSVVVSGLTAARFILSTGVEGNELESLERGTLATEEQIEGWYATAP